MSRFWSQVVRDLTPYVPGEQPKIANLIKLNTNENPFPPSPKVLAAIRELASTDEAVLLSRVYDDVPERMHPMALRSLRAHLGKLRSEGRA